MLKKAWYIIRIIPKLGYQEVCYILWYRFTLKTGIRKRFFPVDKPVPGPYFSRCEGKPDYPETWKPALKPI